MAHLKQRKVKLLARISRLQGQLEGLRRAIETEQDCGDTLHTLAAFRGALNSLMMEVIEGHIRHHVMEPGEGGESPAEAAEELIDVLRRHLR